MESTPYALDYRKQGFHIGRITRPHLATKRRAIVIENDPHDHLIQVRPPVLAESFLPESVPSLTLEIDGGRIKENHIETTEQMAVMKEHGLFHPIFGASGRKRRCSALILDLLSKEAHAR